MNGNKTLYVIITVLLALVSASITYALTVNSVTDDVAKLVSDNQTAIAVGISERQSQQRDIDRLCSLMEKLIEKLPDPKE